MKQKPFLCALIRGFASLGEGMASIFSWGFYSPQRFNYEEHFGTDTELLASDWQKVGDDITGAIQQLEKEVEKEAKNGSK